MKPNRPTPEQFKHDGYIYFKDSEGRYRRTRNIEYKSRPGYIRIKFLEGFWHKWRNSSYDSKLLYFPWIIGLVTAYFIYKSTMLYSQNELDREVKARLPFEFKYEHKREIQKLRKEDQRAKNMMARITVNEEKHT